MIRKLGRRAPHLAATHPRLTLSQFVGDTIAVPEVVDYVSEISTWAMYLNDTIGDCTIAAAGHMIEAWLGYGSGDTEQPGVTDDQVLATYEAVSGYRPNDPDTDRGAVMQDVLDYWRKTGVGGHKIAAFAQVDIKNAAEMKKALYLFGHLYVGVNLPQIAEEQFDAGAAWTVVDDDGGEAGGHAITIGYIGRNQCEGITWGRAQVITFEWLAKYAEEAWVAISSDWLSKYGVSPEGLDEHALGEAFAAMTGEPDPFPSPTPVTPPQPAPGPAPVDDPDADLIAALTPWLGLRHSGNNAAAVKAVETWIEAKHHTAATKPTVSVGVVNMPLYAHPGNGDPIRVGELAVPLYAEAADEGAIIAIRAALANASIAV